MSLRSEISDYLLEMWPRCKVASPEMCHMIAVVREKVWSVDRPFKFGFPLSFLNSCEILIDSAVLEHKLFAKCVRPEDLSYVIEKLVVNMGKLPSEVHASCYHDVVSLIVLGIVLQTSEKNFWVIFYLCVLVEKLILHLHLNCEACPLIHTAGGIIELMHNVSEDRMVARYIPFKTFKCWPPNKFKLFLILSNYFFFIINSGEGNSLKAHTSEQLNSGSWVSKCICMPWMLGNNSEVLLQESVSCHHVHNYFLVCGASLVTGDPSAIYEFKLTLTDEPADLTLDVPLLLVPPSLEVVHLSLRESALRVNF